MLVFKTQPFSLSSPIQELQQGFEEVVETAKNNHIDIITFTGNEKSKISQYSTLPIIIGHYNPFYHDNLVPNAFFGQVLIIFESLLYSFLSSKK